MKIGYARAYPGEKGLETQIAALNAAGCVRIFIDAASGATVTTGRPDLTQLLDDLRPGDRVLACRLERLALSLPVAAELCRLIRERGASFASIAPGEEILDTGGPHGDLVFDLMTALAKYERDIGHHHASAGIAASKTAGCRIGRPRKLNERERDDIRHAIATGRMSNAKAARLYGVSKPTISRIMTEAPDPTGAEPAQDSRHTTRPTPGSEADTPRVGRPRSQGRTPNPENSSTRTKTTQRASGPKP